MPHPMIPSRREGDKKVFTWRENEGDQLLDKGRRNEAYSIRILQHDR